ncbi:MAG: GTPase HflX [Anaerolineae bacterium]|nr:GTPase HflX [Anaerolineae bacterium]MDW8072152.1 GTPase HflX [Anaerolineae bacterium]
MKHDEGVNTVTIPDPRHHVHKLPTGHPAAAPRERGFLVGVELKRFRPSAPAQDGGMPRFAIEDSLEELAALARTAGIEVVGGTYQRLERINPATYIGKGKLEELQSFRDELAVDLFIFDDELSPAQMRELERALERKVIDRTALILDVFAQHAHTREGQLQVELAQYEYRLPRLTRLWTHLARQAGGRAGGATGGVGLRGPGETQLESDRRLIRRHIARLKAELELVREHRARYRRKRRRAAIPTVAIVGYTNAGKSTLLNALSQADVLVADMLFATLDPTTRRVKLPGGREVLFTDTVGFIQKLPTTLVAAFRATLEEISEADLILHVIDITHRNAMQQAATVATVLEEIGATHAPLISALNKIDRLADPSLLNTLLAEFPNSIPISAATGQGLDLLLARIEEVLNADLVPLRVRLPYQQGQLLALLHAHGHIRREEYGPQGTTVEGFIPAHLSAQFRPFAV